MSPWSQHMTDRTQRARASEKRPQGCNGLTLDCICVLVAESPAEARL